MHTKSYKYPLLNDVDWLKEKYVNERLSTREVAVLAGARTPNSARQALIRHGIPVRSISDGLTCDRSDDGFVLNLPVITGCLLGDGGLYCASRRSENSFPHFKKRNKNVDHIRYVARALFPSTWEDQVRISQEHFREKKYSISYIRSLSHQSLQVLYRDWYPQSNNYRKVIPGNIIIDREVLLHWFLDDGSSEKRQRAVHKKQIRIVFCSESFSYDDQELLRQKIQEILGLTFSLRKVSFGSGWRLELPQSQADIFYDIIGPCPVPSLSYKWK